MRALWLLGGTVLIALIGVAVLLPMFGHDDSNLPRLHPGLDLQGGTQLVYRIQAGGFPVDEASANVRDVLQGRYADAEIDAFVHARGERIVVDIPGSNPSTVESARLLASRDARFEMRLVDESTEVLDELPLPAGVERETENLGEGTRIFFTALDDAGRESLVALGREHDLPLAVGRVATWEAAYEPTQEQWRTYLVKEVQIDGSDIADAHVGTAPPSPEPVVLIHFGQRGATTLEEMTQNVGTRLAIVLNDEVMSAPVIASPIPGGRAQITLGQRDSYEQLLAEANELVVMLRAGALPAPLILDDETRVDATSSGLAWGILWGSVFVFVLAAVFGVVRRRERGLTLVLPLLVMPVGFAALAIMHATATTALFVGVVSTCFVLLATSAIVRTRYRAAPKASRVWVGAVPALAAVALSVGGGVLFAFASGPLKGAAAGVLVTAIVGVPISASWIAGALSWESRVSPRDGSTGDL